MPDRGRIDSDLSKDTVNIPARKFAQTAAALTLVIVFTAADKPSPWKRLKGVWEGKPVLEKKEPAPDDDSLLARQFATSRRLADSLRLSFDFQSRNLVVLSLSQAGKPADAKQVNWRVTQEDGDNLELTFTLQVDKGKVVRRLNITFSDDDKKFTAEEVNGDPRIPPLVFTRPPSK